MYKLLSIMKERNGGSGMEIDDKPEKDDCGLMKIIEKSTGVVKIV